MGSPDTLVSKKPSLVELSVCVLVALLPWLSGAASFTASRQLLLGVYLLIGLLAFLAVLRIDARDQDMLFMFAILCLSLSLLFSWVMMSNNLLGYDVQQEYQLFSGVLQTGGWTPDVTNLYNSVISITILPFVIGLVSGLDGISIFRIVFPAVYALFPVILYSLYRNILSPRSAYLAVFLFMSSYYYDMIQLARQEVAELLVVVLLLILLSPKVRRGFSGILVTILLTTGIVLSHYSTAFVFVLLVIFASVAAAIVRRRDVALFDFTSLLLLGSICFGWYMLVAGGVAMNNLSGVIARIVNGVFGGFLNLSTRSSEVALVIGFKGASGILHDLNRVTVYAVQAFLMLGFMALLLKRGKSASEWKMLPILAVGFILIGSVVVLPYFAASLTFNRMYHIFLLYAAPCFLYGVGVLDSSFQKLGSFLNGMFHVRMRVHFRTKPLIAAGILCCYFLFMSGWVWAASMDIPTSQLLDSQRMRTTLDIGVSARYFSYVTSSEDIGGALWLQAYYSDSRPVCGDVIAEYHVLNSYGGFPQNGPNLPTCEYRHNAYVFISEFNNLRGAASAVTDSPPDVSMSEVSPHLSGLNRVYSDGATIYVGDSENWYS